MSIYALEVAVTVESVDGGPATAHRFGPAGGDFRKDVAVDRPKPGTIDRGAPRVLVFASISLTPISDGCDAPGGCADCRLRGTQSTSAVEGGQWMETHAARDGFHTRSDLDRRRQGTGMASS